MSLFIILIIIALIDISAIVIIWFWCWRSGVVLQILIIKGKWNDLTELKHRLTKSYKFKTFIAAAFAIVLTALTFFSIQILEAIFGNGMVEVGLIIN